MADVEVLDADLLAQRVGEVDPDLVKALVAYLDGDAWQMADLLAERFPVDQYGSGGKTNTALYEALDAAEDVLRREYGVELKASTMRHYRSTAIAWPDVARTTSASFAAHQKLRGEDRLDLMARYLKRNKGRPLSKRDVMRYRADDNPKPPKPWDLATRQRIESVVRSQILGGVVTKREDWWNVEGLSEAVEAVQAMLYDLANRMGRR